MDYQKRSHQNIYTKLRWRDTQTAIKKCYPRNNAGRKNSEVSNDIIQIRVPITTNTDDEVWEGKTDEEFVTSTVSQFWDWFVGCFLFHHWNLGDPTFCHNNYGGDFPFASSGLMRVNPSGARQQDVSNGFDDAAETEKGNYENALPWRNIVCCRAMTQRH